MNRQLKSCRRVGYRIARRLDVTVRPSLSACRDVPVHVLSGCPRISKVKACLPRTVGRSGLTPDSCHRAASTILSMFRILKPVSLFACCGAACCAPSRTRTDTLTVLSRLPLPIGLWGLANTWSLKSIPYRPRRSRRHWTPSGVSSQDLLLGRRAIEARGPCGREPFA